MGDRQYPRYFTILHKGLEHPRVLVWAGVGVGSRNQCPTDTEGWRQWTRGKDTGKIDNIWRHYYVCKDVFLSDVNHPLPSTQWCYPYLTWEDPGSIQWLAQIHRVKEQSQFLKPVSASKFYSPCIVVLFLSWTDSSVGKQYSSLAINICLTCHPRIKSRYP